MYISTIRPTTVDHGVLCEGPVWSSMVQYDSKAKAPTMDTHLRVPMGRVANRFLKALDIFLDSLVPGELLNPKRIVMAIDGYQYQ